jgi:Mlc titration factor MtfA (ptsG expression regulator)
MEIPKIIIEPYNAAQFQNYRRLYKELFKKEAASCGCASKQVYDTLHNYYKNQPVNEKQP